MESPNSLQQTEAEYIEYHDAWNYSRRIRWLDAGGWSDWIVEGCGTSFYPGMQIAPILGVGADMEGPAADRPRDIFMVNQGT